MSLIEEARSLKANPLVAKVARLENVPVKELLKNISRGYAVIPKNRLRRIGNPCAIGKGLRTKVNVNIGTSPDSCDVKEEIKKLEMSVRFGTDTIMDLSIGKNVRGTRRRILEKCPVPLGTVPIYEAAVNVQNDISLLEESDLMNILKTQAEDGVDFFTIHAGVTRKTVAMLENADRLIDIVSRGGAILYKWIKTHDKENPYYEYFDEVLDLAKAYDITLSLGDGMRPGAVADASDKPQFGELDLLGDLQKRALRKGVQTIIEGPGHVPMHKIKQNIDKEKTVCNGAPFYVLGPLVTDIAPGYDHITAAIGGAMAAMYGADFLCYVTPSEHLRLPDIDDVKEGLIASKIAAHAADLAKGNKQAWEKDVLLSRARRKRDWKKQFSLSIDPVKPVQYRKSSNPSLKDVCTMCSRYCPIKITER